MVPLKKDLGSEISWEGGWSPNPDAKNHIFWNRSLGVTEHPGSSETVDFARCTLQSSMPLVVQNVATSPEKMGFETIDFPNIFFGK